MKILGNYTTRQVYTPPVWAVWERPLYIVRQDTDDPLRMECGDDVLYMPDNYLSDKGSIPRAAQVLVPKDQYEAEFLFHDLEFSLHGVLKYGRTDNIVYRRSTLANANYRLLRGMQIQDSSYAAQNAFIRAVHKTFNPVVHAGVYAAVSTAGAVAWQRWRDRSIARTVIETVNCSGALVSWPWKHNLLLYGKPIPPDID